MKTKQIESYLFNLYINLLDEKSALEKRIEEIDIGLDEISDTFTFLQYFNDDKLSNSLNFHNKKLTTMRVEDYDSPDVRDLLEKYNENDDSNDTTDDHNNEKIKEITNKILKGIPISLQKTQ